MRSVEDLLDAVDVTGEARDDHSSGRLAEHLLDGRDQIAFRHHESRNLGVRRVDEEQVEALLAETRESSEVGDPAVQRELVHLEVARVQDQAGVGADGDGEAIGNGMVDGEEFEPERPFLTRFAGDDLDQSRRDLELLELCCEEVQGEA